MMRTLLILAFLAQQLWLPTVAAHNSGQCQASVKATDQPLSCCFSSQQANDEEQPAGCACVPSLCACEGHQSRAPAAPDRNNRSIDQLVPSLAMPMAALPAPPRAVEVIRPDGRIVGMFDHHRIQAVLCIWRT